MATMTKTLYRERLQTKLLTDVHKQVEEVLSDRFGLDAWVQARLVERLFSSKNEQQDLKQRLADKLMKKREMLEVIVQRETKAAQKHSRTARADFLRNTETVRLAFTEFVHVALMFQLEKH